MKAGLFSIWCTIMLLCLSSYFFTVKARLTGFNSLATLPQQPALHQNEGESFAQDAYMTRSSTIKKKLLSILPAKNKVAATKFKVSVQGKLVHNDAHGIESETLTSDGGETQIFSRHRNDSKNETAPAMKKNIAVMAFRPSSSGHSPGGGHGNPPGGS